MLVTSVFALYVFFDRVLRLGTRKKRRLKNNIYFQQKSCAKSIYLIAINAVSRLIIDKRGDYKECGSLGADHLKETKRKNFCSIFQFQFKINLVRRPYY